MSRFHGNHSPGGIGWQIEHGAFGPVRSDLGGQEKKIPDYLEYMPAPEKVRTIQRGDPENPDRAFARDLRIEIIDALGFETVEECSRVRLYTAVGSAFDRYHGVDAFVEVDTDTGKVIVTIDITAQQKEVWKADICVQFPEDDLDPDLDQKEYFAMIAKVAQAVMRKLNGEVQKQYVS